MRRCQVAYGSRLPATEVRRPDGRGVRASIGCLTFARSWRSSTPTRRQGGGTAGAQEQGAGGSSCCSCWLLPCCQLSLRCSPGFSNCVDSEYIHSVVCVTCCFDNVFAAQQIALLTDKSWSSAGKQLETKLSCSLHMTVNAMDEQRPRALVPERNSKIVHFIFIGSYNIMQKLLEVPEPERKFG
ncbi:hypothetical protein ZWY2020_013017 [Hordeum vulgare]|nr:hypothetical protein ZWY2020_013017 [Hordeum vulgare]